MPKKSSGSALGLLLLFAPVAWVCGLCGGDDRSPPAKTPSTERPSSPAAAPMSTEPVVPVAAPAPEPEPHRATHRGHAKRVHHETPTAIPRTSTSPSDPTADAIDRALEDARSTPASKPEPRERSPVAAASETCCRHCGPTSKPCGDSCISLSKTCHKGRGCAC